MFRDNDVYVSGDVMVEKLYCSGKILFEDLGNRFEEHEHRRMETEMSNLQHWSNSMTANELLIEGNIIFNDCFHKEEDVFQIVTPVSDNINPKIMTIRCNNFLMSHKLIIKDNCIHTTNNEVIVKLRKMKIDKLKKNE